MPESKFSEQEIAGGNYNIEFYFTKDKRDFRLTMRKDKSCSYIKIDEQNDAGDLFHSCKWKNTAFHDMLAQPLDNVLLEIYELTNKLMNNL